MSRGELDGRLCLPDRKQRLEAGAGEPLLAITADILEKQIAEGHVREALCDEPRDGGPHDRFVLGVRARPRQGHDVQRQSGRRGLCLEQLASDGVHRDPIERFIVS